jgi:acyl-CoA hydrolase
MSVSRESRISRLGRCSAVAATGLALLCWVSLVLAAPVQLAAQEAAARMGRHVFVATGSAMPPDILPWMRAAAMAREGRTDVYYMSTFASAKNFVPEIADKWHANLFFASAGNREAATKGTATMHRASLFQLSQQIQRGKFPIDTVLVRVSPPDAKGYVSLGTTGDLTLHAVKAVLKRGGTIIAEVNPNVPQFKGNRIRYSDLSVVVPGEQLLTEFNGINPMAVERRIARNVASLVPNRRRSNIQVGIGNAVNGIGEALREGADRGKRMTIWSEMGSDWVIPLMEGEKPAVKKATFSFLHGSNRLYSLANKNPRMDVTSTAKVNDPKVVSQKKRMRAINTALEVDVLGNVNAERIDGRVISFPGGQPDFMKGASMAADGRAILAIRSTAKEGISTIVMGLHSGGLVTTPKEHVDHIVTEWGKTKQLRGLSDGDRAYEIIKVASPVHRLELARTAQAQGLLTENQVQKVSRSVFHSLRLADPEVLRETAVAQQAFDKGLITGAQLAQVTAKIEPAQQ